MRRASFVSALALGICGCSDYALNGPPEPSAAQPGGAAGTPDTDDTSAATDTDSGGGTVSDPCDDTGALTPRLTVSGVEADPEAAAPVCTALGSVDWEMVEEWRVAMPGFVMGPIAAPNQGRPGASVFVDAGSTMIELDGRDGSEIQTKMLIANTGSDDDGSTPTVADVDHDGDLEFAAPGWAVTNVVDTGSGTKFTFETGPPDAALGDDEVIQFVDIDLDGSAEIVLSTGVYAADGAPVVEQTSSQATQTFVTDLDGDGFPEWVNGTGIWDPRDGTGAAFGTSPTSCFYGAPIDASGGAVAYAGVDRLWNLVRSDATVIAQRVNPLGPLGGLVAVGDVDGDALPDVVEVQRSSDTLVVSDAGGVVKRSWTLEERDLAGGGVSLADLDADGVYEIVLLRRSGLSILSGLTGEVLGETTAVGTDARDSAPIIADVDGDGSAEIVAMSNVGVDAGDLVALGPATGRWARTRPIWNQLSYDAAAVHDDGTLAPFAEPGWSSLHAFRAQPGRDGELPDLAVSLSATPGEVCEEPTELVTVVVRNVGSLESPAGAVLRLSAWDGAARTVLVETVLAAAIPPGERVVVTWEGALDTLGLVAEIEPVGAECDGLDDQAELLPL